jgi:hypothetical protein
MSFYVKSLHVGNDNKGLRLVMIFFFSILYQPFYIKMVNVSFYKYKLFCNVLYNKTSTFSFFCTYML